MTTSEVNTSTMPPITADEPKFVKDTNRKVNAAMRGFLGQLMEPFIEAYAKVRKTLGGHESVSNNTLELVQNVMALRTNLSEAANSPNYTETKKVVNS